MRKYNLYVLVDQSGSMAGQHIIHASGIVRRMMSELKNGPYPLDDTSITVLQYNSNVYSYCWNDSIDAAMAIDIDTACEGPKNLGDALTYVYGQIDEGKPDMKPVVVIISRGLPSDVQKFNQMSLYIKKHCSKVIVLHGNMQKANAYKKISDNIIDWNSFDMAGIVDMFWPHASRRTQPTKPLTESTLFLADVIELEAPPKVIELNI